MKIQVFYPNKDGKIEFTKEELEKLLQEVYDDGHSDGYSEGKNSRIYWYPNTITTPYYYSTTTAGTATLKSENINDLTGSNKDLAIKYADSVSNTSKQGNFGYNPYQE